MPTINSSNATPEEGDMIATAERGPEAAESFMHHIREVIASRGIDPAALDVDPADTPESAAAAAAALRAEVYRAAWLNSLVAGHVDDLAEWTIDRLAADQHPVVMRRFAEDVIAGNHRVNTLVLGGGVGPGKTSSAIAVGNAAAAGGRLVRFVRHSTYLKMLRPGGAPRGVEPWQVRARFRDCDLLILDDLGAELDVASDGSQFARDETLNLIGDRADARNRATIITTNQSSEVLTTMFGEQLLSRISKRGYAVAFTGPDRRGRLSW